MAYSDAYNYMFQINDVMIRIICTARCLVDGANNMLWANCPLEGRIQAEPLCQNGNINLGVADIKRYMRGKKNSFRQVLSC